MLALPLDAAYLKQRTLTVDHTKVGSSDASNFPVVLCVNGATNCTAVISDFKDAGHGGLVQNTSSLTYGGRTFTVPDDLVISSSNCNSPTLLSWEVTAYDNTTGSLILYFKAPTVSHTADSVFYLCYDNSAVSTWQGNINGVWTAYVYVQHGVDGTTAYLYDSTSTGATLTASSGSLTTNTSVGAPPIGMGSGDGVVDTVSSRIHSTAVATIGPNISTTLESWVFFFTGTGGLSASPVSTDCIATKFGLLLMSITGTNYGAFVNKCAAGPFENATGGTFSTGTWTHQVAVADGSAHTISLYLNGVFQSSVAYSATTLGAGTQSVGIDFGGDWNGSVIHDQANARNDETRVSMVAQGADYITASYNSTNNPSTFVTIGSGTAPPSGIHHRTSMN